MIRRRDFIKVFGGALGAVILTSSCSDHGRDSDATPVTPIPNGYRFFRIISSGDSLPGGNTLFGIPGSVMLNDSNEAYFYCLDQTESNGFYELIIDYGESRPTVSQLRKVVREGDVLDDSKVVSQITMGDTNNQGSFAAVLHTDDKLSGVYLSRAKGGFEPVAGYLTPLPGGGGRFGASFGDVSIHTDDEMLIVAHFAPSDTVQGHQGVFHLPGGEVNQSGVIVASTRDAIPDTDGFMTGFGLVGLHDHGNFVLQSYGITADNLGLLQAVKPGDNMNIEAASMLIHGSVGKPLSKKLLSASPSLIKGVAAGLAGNSVGEIKFGPRIGGSNDVAFVTHVTGTQQVLYYSGKQVVSTGAVTPLGAIIVSLSAPVVGSDRLLYFQAVTNKGLELMVYNGAELRTILSKDDIVDGSALTSFLFGFMPEQVDSSGRIVLTGDFGDGSTSLIIGIPI